jgi:nitroreductase
MNLTEAIFGRRAVRDYALRKVDEATLRTLLRAAVQAPSAMNRQPWLFSVVQNVASLKRYSDRAKSLLLEQAAGDPKAKHYEDRLRNPAFNIFYNASTLVVIGAAERGPYTDADCWLAAGNLMLAACEGGLGTCCIGLAVALLNTPEVKAQIGLPANGVAVAPLIVGYASAIPAPVPRADPKIAWWDR